MCSIAGGYSKTKERLEMMRHRSPDGMRVVTDDGFEMGMGRLAIIDVQNDDFPMSRSGRTISFNGEIYNYLEIRDELEFLGYRFQTEGDTEVLLNAYIEWGEKCLNKLNGMFAFAIYDGQNVFLARDIAGEKPLYYTTEPFAFASEAKALGFDCKELPPAHSLKYNLRTNKISKKRWWSFKQQHIQIETAEEELDYLLKDSIRLRTRSDVPYVLYLSDGVDSNLIRTYQPFLTATYVDDPFDKQDFFKSIERIVWHLDYPVDSFSAFALWTLAKETHQVGAKVVLSGEGADELFGGYVRYVPNAMNLKARDTFPSYETFFPIKSDPGFADFNGKMQTLLRMGDRMASAHGVENRCPFLDRRIIEFAFSLPNQLRAYGMDTKIILKSLLKKRLPSYQFGEKHGLYCSVNKWMGVDDPFSKKEYLQLQQRIFNSHKESWVKNKIQKIELV